jgi:hypothetical protein
VASHQVDRGRIDGDADPERAAAHLRRRRAVIVELHGRRPGREGSHALDVTQRQAREKADADTAPVRIRGQLDMPVAREATVEILQRRRVTYLLNGKDVGARGR